jgi:tRNA (guanine37-N1)-methyltransferase
MTVLTLFPELIHTVVSASVTGRAIRKGLFSVDTIQVRDFAVNDYGQVDDTLYGGGTGMLLRPEPVFSAWETALRAASPAATRTIHLTPKGKVLDQRKVETLAAYDQRVLDQIVDEEISIGDYVLTGGELAALVVMDSVARLLPGVLPSSDAHEQESHSLGRLEQPHYTRPAIWQGKKVPDVLTSGHQANIDRFQYLASLQETLLKRPDLFNQMKLSASDYKELIEFYCQHRDPLV